MGNKIVQRAIFPEILAHLQEPEITVIIGPRQSGKTTLVNLLKNNLIEKQAISPEKVFYFNLDLISDRQIFLDQTAFIRFIKNRMADGKKIFVFVDEAQRIENAGLFFKGVYDLNLPVKLILTGSSSLEIRAKIMEPLTGRKRLFHLLPFSFQEYLNFKDASVLPFLNGHDPLATPKIMSFLLQFIVSGGYPKVAIETDPARQAVFLEEIYTSYLEKDISALAKIKDPYSFTKFVRILAEESGNLLNIEKTSQELGIKNETLKKYLDILEKTFVTAKVHPFFHSTRTEIRKMPKIYFLDTGLRNFSKEGKKFTDMEFSNRSDRGALLENFVFSELTKSGTDNICFWRTKDGAEVDFVLPTAKEVIPIEIKATKLSKIEITKSFASFLKRYKPKKGFVVNLEKQATIKMYSSEIHFLLPFQLTSLAFNQ